MQLTFDDAKGLGERKQTRRKTFLAEMKQVVPWKALLTQIEPHYPCSERAGRPPYAMETMLRIHLLQQWCALSDHLKATRKQLQRVATDKDALDAMKAVKDVSGGSGCNCR